MQIIEDLFDLSAHSCGKLAIREDFVKMADIVARAIERQPPDYQTQSLAHGFASAGAALRFCRPHAAGAGADELADQRRQVHRSGRYIRLSVTEECGEIVVRIRDNGRGIASELLPASSTSTCKPPITAAAAPAASASASPS